MSSLGDLLRGDWLKTPIDAALRVTPNALFSGDRLRWHLEKQFSKPGMTNDFHRLKKELYVGATDQDTGTHVTFGEKGFREVPISHAVRASCAMTPYYPPEKVGGRFYIDGIFTRTINLDVAVAHGANLIICVDPLTPVSTEQPGYVSGRGGFFNTVQSIKSMLRTRYTEVIGRAEEAYPNATVIEFFPSPKDLEKMSGTMMRFFYRTETEEMAYASTVERIKRDYAWLAADLGRHGFALKPDRN
jgi:predicted acylesterase/phospholipase RssA